LFLFCPFRISLPRRLREPSWSKSQTLQKQGRGNKNVSNNTYLRCFKSFFEVVPSGTDFEIADQTRLATAGTASAGHFCCGQVSLLLHWNATK
jgi:hypothetical protein